MPCRNVALLAVALSCLVWCGGARKVEVTARKRWKFIDKFVFDVRGNTDGPGEPPLVEFWAENVPVDTYKFVLYSDQSYSWPAARGIVEDEDLWQTDEINACNTLSTCPDVLNCSTCMMRICPGGIPLHPTCDGSGHCHGTRAYPNIQAINQHARPRFWYAATTNCEPDQSALKPIKVHVHFRNPGGWFRSEFGVDEQGILELQLIIVPFFAIMGGAYMGMTHRELRRQGDGAEVHAVVKWFLVIIILQILYYLDKLRTYLLVATNGEGHQVFEFAGFLASVMFMMLVVNFATGFSAIGVHFFTPMKDSSHQKVIGGLGLFLILWSFVLFVWTKVKQDPLYVQSPYQTWPSILLAAARGPIIIYYLYCLYNTMQEVPEQREYYKKWGLGFLLYLLSLPFFTILASVVSSHVQFRAVDITVDIATVVSMSFMCYLLWPGPGLTNVLSNTYTLSASGPTHIPMSDGAVSVYRNAAAGNSSTGALIAPPPPPPQDTTGTPLETTINGTDEDGNPLRPLVAS
eukprot:TRINITY_DN9119_c0_g1_i1.p1 TRINITY_DN9119_c0_g1~~TRINITY_DN9119_c0_g1_i1.p1  ORF type:complete len:518 (+),score=136.39 TRINITY_DN9119_c0_g1_i1:990-2543(+)